MSDKEMSRKMPNGGISHLFEEEIDDLVLAEADDDSAREEPINVKRVPERPDSRK